MVLCYVYFQFALVQVYHLYFLFFQFLYCFFKFSIDCSCCFVFCLCSNTHSELHLQSKLCSLVEFCFHKKNCYQLRLNHLIRRVRLQLIKLATTFLVSKSLKKIGISISVIENARTVEERNFENFKKIKSPFVPK